MNLERVGESTRVCLSLYKFHECTSCDGFDPLLRLRASDLCVDEDQIGTEALVTRLDVLENKGSTSSISRGG